MVHLFVVYVYQEADEDAEKLQLTDRLLQAVLAEAQVVCIGQPMLIAGDLSADPAVIPCQGTGSRRDFFVGCPNPLAASQACYVTFQLSYWCLDG